MLLPVASAGWKGMAGAAAWRRPRPIARWPPRRSMGCVPRAAGRSPAQGWPRRPAAWGVVAHDVPAAGAVADPQGGTATLAPSKTTGFSGRRRLLRPTPSRQACHGPGMCDWTARIGQSERSDHIAEQNISAQRIGDRRGITTGGQVALMTLGYRKVIIRIRKSAGLGYPCRVGRPSQGLRRAPQKPHNSATRRPIPTGIPRTKRHTPVHLLCVLKIRKIAGQQRRCA